MKKSAKPRTLHNIKRKAEPYIWLLPSILMMGILILLAHHHCVPDLVLRHQQGWQKQGL